MLLSVCQSAFDGSVIEQIAAAAAAGFEALELRSPLDGQPLSALSEAEFAELSQRAADEGLTIATLALGPVDELVAAPDTLRHMAALSGRSGARLRIFSRLRPGVSDPLEAQGEPDQDLWDQELELWGRCQEIVSAENRATLVMLEAEVTSVANTAARAARLLEALDRRCLGYNWDFVNCWRAGEHPWPGPWPYLRGMTYGIHLKGARADRFEPDRYGSQCLPADDDVPHRAICAALVAAGFEGPVTVDPDWSQFLPADRPDPAPATPSAWIAAESLPFMAACRAHAWAR